MRDKKIAKCPGCLPDVRGAIFRATYDESDKGLVPVWKCSNCWYKLPRKSYKPEPKITASQQEVIDLLKAAGWVVETSFIGRKVWIHAKHPTKSWISGNSLYGTVGPSGGLKLNLQRFGSDQVLTLRDLQREVADQK